MLGPFLGVYSIFSRLFMIGKPQTIAAEMATFGIVMILLISYVMMLQDYIFISKDTRDEWALQQVHLHENGTY